jgi:hypothetical protein
LPVGADGTTLVADSSQTNGLRWGNDYQLFMIMGVYN